MLSDLFLTYFIVLIFILFLLYTYTHCYKCVFLYFGLIWPHGGGPTILKQKEKI